MIYPTRSFWRNLQIQASKPVGAGTLESATVKLLKAPFVPSLDSAIAGLSVADYDAYADGSLPSGGVGNWQRFDGSDGLSVQVPAFGVVFGFSAPVVRANMIYGIALIDGNFGILTLATCLFATPLAMQRQTDFIDLKFRFAFRSQTDIGDLIVIH